MSKRLIVFFVAISMLLVGCGSNTEDSKEPVSPIDKNQIEKYNNNQNDTFEELLNRTNLAFVKPEGFNEVPTIENRQMNYEKAFKHPTKNFEVRYAIRPIDHLLKDHKEREANKSEGAIHIHPNEWYKNTFEMTALNIGGGKLPNYTVFPEQAAKSEFNADWGATTTVEVGKEFGQDFKYGLLVFIHKDNLGDGYVFYLSDDKKLMTEEMGSIFHSLTFKEI